MTKDIHTWFGLTYAQYLTIPRSVLQSMPEEWQHKFVELLDKLDDTNWLDKLPRNTSYRVELREMEDSLDGWEWGVKVTDPLGSYDRGRRNVFKEK